MGTLDDGKAFLFGDDFMRVLLVETISELGGAQWSLLDLACQLKQDGADLLAAVPRGPLQARLKDAGVPVGSIASFRARRKPLARVAQFLTGANEAAQIRKTAWLFKPDIIHANSITAGLLSLPLARGRALVCHVRDLRFPVKPMIQIARQARRIVAASDSIDNSLSEFLHGSSRSRLVRVVNGIDVNRFAPCDPARARQTCGLPADGPVIGMVAHLTPWKRHELFIEMAAQIAQKRPDAHFVIVGRDLLGENKPYGKSLRQLVTTSGLDAAFHWLDAISDVREALQALDVLVHPPHDEPFGRVLCEAMAMRRPVVAVRQNGPASIVEHGVSGLLVHAPDPKLFTQAALQLLDNPAQAEAMGEAGRKRVLERFNITRTAIQMRAVYQAAINEFDLERLAHTDKT
jgi:glycosyltransferase involved in cell wall biosynthesis